MADKGIKNVVVPLSMLPYIGGDESYYVRYRIVSDDKNKSSHWSQVVAVPQAANIPYTNVIDGGQEA